MRPLRATLLAALAWAPLIPIGGQSPQPASAPPSARTLVLTGERVTLRVARAGAASVSLTAVRSTLTRDPTSGELRARGENARRPRPNQRPRRGGTTG